MRAIPKVSVYCQYCKALVLKDKRFVEASLTKRFFCNQSCKCLWQSADARLARDIQKEQSKLKRARPSFVCETCGVGFENTWNLKNNRKYCSIACSLKVNGVDKRVRSDSKIDVVCDFCKEDFKLWPYRVVDGKPTYCSRECRANSNRDFLNCPNCLKDFIAPKNEKRVYCSQTCFQEHKKYNRSKGEEAIYQYLLANGVTCQFDVSMLLPSGAIRPDIVCGNKVIEFFGDYWHCHDSLYEDAYFHEKLGMTALERREQDQQRIRDLKNMGYDTLVVWEHDFKKDSEAVMAECFNFVSTGVK